jgi:hypothetical protein
MKDGAQLARFRVLTDIEVTREPVTGAWRTPTNSQMNVDAKFPTTVVFGPPGAEDTRGIDLRAAIADVREIIESFAPAFP